MKDGQPCCSSNLFLDSTIHFTSGVKRPKTTTGTSSRTWIGSQQCSHMQMSSRMQQSRRRRKSRNAYNKWNWLLASSRLSSNCLQRLPTSWIIGQELLQLCSTSSLEHKVLPINGSGVLVRWVTNSQTLAGLQSLSRRKPGDGLLREKSIENSQSKFWSQVRSICLTRDRAVDNYQRRLARYARFDQGSGQRDQPQERSVSQSRYTCPRRNASDT